MLVEFVDYTYYNKASLVLLTPLFIVFFMCMVDVNRTQLLFRSLFSNTYFYRYPYDSVDKFSLFQVLILFFISTILTLFLMFLRYDSVFIYEHFLEAFTTTFWLSLGYFVVKYFLSEFLYSSSNKKPYFKQMLMLETSYLTIVMLVVFLILCYVFLHLNSYESVIKYVLTIASILYFIRFIVLIVNNKNLLSGKILYIILYLCTLEIVPFIYLFKSYTE